MTHYSEDGTDVVFTLGEHKIEIGTVYLARFVRFNIKEEYKDDIWYQADKDYTTIDITMLNENGLDEMFFFLKYNGYAEYAEELRKFMEVKKVGQAPILDKVLKRFCENHPLQLYVAPNNLIF